MRIGELLLQHGWVSWEALALAIGDQPASRMRLCSLLVKREALDFDLASRALGQLHGSAAALRRHLEGRDESLADLLPDDAAKDLVALPIGRLGNGALIVCVRDPSPALRAKLARLIGEEPVLAVAPAHYLERIVANAYAPRVLDSAELEEANDDDAGSDVDVPIDVDDDSANDFAIDVEMPAARPAPRARRASIKKRPLSIVIPVIDVPTAGPASERDALDATLLAFREIDEPQWLFDVAMQYLSKHWTSSLLLALRETRAVGTRGQGAKITPTIVKTFIVDIEDVAALRLARDDRRIVDETPEPPGTEHAMVSEALGCAQPIMAPVVTRDRVSHVLAVGDPVGKERESALVDLGMLVEAMGEALARM